MSVILVVVLIRLNQNSIDIIFGSLRKQIMRCRQLLPLSLLAVPLMATAAEGYPTLTTVDYVLECMDRHGGADVDNERSCVCEFDQIAAAMPSEDFDNAMAYREFKDVPADKGGEFRDSKWAKDLYEKVLDTRKKAEHICFIKHIKPKKSTETQNQ